MEFVELKILQKKRSVRLLNLKITIASIQYETQKENIAKKNPPGS